jgi:lipopolysaccharide transport system permease protein
MSAAYLDPQVTIDGVIHTGFEIRNDSRETWRAAEGFAISYHLYDADTGTLLYDGPRVHPGGDIKQVRLDIELPPGDGRYQAIISPMREDTCWYYDRGWPFLLVDTAGANGAATGAGLRLETAAGLRRKRTLRAIGRAFVYPFATIWNNRGLIRVMVRRDILGRYRGSFGGSFWTILNPLLLMLTYFFVFGVVLKARFNDQDTSRTAFALYFLAGMLPWLAFSEAVGRSPSLILEHRNFVKKLVFAVETLPVNVVVSGLVSELFAIVLYCGFLLSVRHTLPPTVLWLPALMIPQLMFTAGLSWFLAALGVFVRDLGQIMGFLLTVWFFITPICYPESNVAPFVNIFLSKNPILVLVRGYRAIFLEHQPPAFGPLWKFWLLSFVVFVLGHAWFYKLRKSFVDLI